MNFITMNRIFILIRDLTGQVQGGYDYSYPDENLAMSYDSKWENATFNGDSADLSDGEWQYLESSFMNINNDNYKILSLVFQAQNLGKKRCCICG